MFTLRVATGKDAQELSSVAFETFLDGWGSVVGEELATSYAKENLSPEKLTAELENPEQHYFVLAIDRETESILGYGKLHRGREVPECITGSQPLLLQRLYVKGIGRGAGVADALLVACEQEAIRGGFTTLWLECDPNNQRAWRFYQKRNFVERGKIVYALPNGANDNVRLMERPL